MLALGAGWSRVLASSASSAPAGTLKARASASSWSRPGSFSPRSQALTVLAPARGIAVARSVTLRPLALASRRRVVSSDMRITP
nr:hypothetical protein [Lysobacter enzymogenes]